ncbi:hypothetical protein TSTA_110320 [Talaromyces stipitatus ATCC 10500]|uniref:Uncharacterized protein n=1 Tax=Talaromyces stipitatus (strain ATCC 10500 / CBS 375.48 / QM 6759 / NRRL 1006) TaxID=441959 RepID=B8MUI0_TALSN|nr:uncharacterized protein TSTA_110320 [Talaromyces stipitatus ATCC 10500]EED11852.1 hypothetical protein TSTA_110320 [Talaromyces stipitatus ATCC 10500]
MTNSREEIGYILSFSDRLRPLEEADGFNTKDKVTQAEELLATHFTPIPKSLKHEGTQSQREPIHIPHLMIEKIKRKAPGDDGLPAMIPEARAYSSNDGFDD